MLSPSQYRQNASTKKPLREEKFPPPEPQTRRGVKQIQATRKAAMTTYDYESERFLDRFDLRTDEDRQTNLLLPGMRFQIFAMIAIFAGAALAFVT
jgi:hypothetical protein